MGKHLKSIAKSFLEGFTSFALYPTYAPPPTPRRRRRTGIGKYFGKAGAYIYRAAESEGFSRHG